MSEKKDNILQSYLKTSFWMVRWGAVTFVSLWCLGQMGCSSQTCADLSKEWASTMAAPASWVPSDAVSMGLSVRTSQIEEAAQEALRAPGVRRMTRRRSVPGLGALKVQVELRDPKVALKKGAQVSAGLDTGLTVRVEVKAKGLVLFSKKGRGRLKASVPMSLREEGGGAAVLAHMDRAKIHDMHWKVKAPGWAGPMVDPLLRSATQSLLKQFGEPVTLTQVEALRVPSSKIKLRPKEMILGSSGVLWVGFVTSMPLPPGVKALRPSFELEKGDSAMLHLSTAASTGLMRVLIKEGHLPTRFDENFKPDPKGVHRISLESLSHSAEGLKMNLSLWRLAQDEDETCYAARAQGRAKFHVKQSRSKMRVSVQDLEVIDSRGEDLGLRAALWWRSLFFERAMEAHTELLRTWDVSLGALGDQTLSVRDVKSEPGVLRVALGIKKNK